MNRHDAFTTEPPQVTAHRLRQRLIDEADRLEQEPRILYGNPNAVKPQGVIYPPARRRPQQ